MERYLPCLNGSTTNHHSCQCSLLFVEFHPLAAIASLNCVAFHPAVQSHKLPTCAAMVGTGVTVELVRIASLPP